MHLVQSTWTHSLHMQLTCNPQGMKNEIKCACTYNVVCVKLSTLSTCRMKRRWGGREGGGGVTFTLPPTHYTTYSSALDCHRSACMLCNMRQFTHWIVTIVLNLAAPTSSPLIDLGQTAHAELWSSLTWCPCVLRGSVKSSILLHRSHKCTGRERCLGVKEQTLHVHTHTHCVRA